MIKPIQACLILGIFCFSQVSADEIRIAVASNFAEAIKAIAQQFEQQSGHRVILIFGSTGKHYAQIKNGAPFDAFFAADTKRPKLLDEEGIALVDSRFTYAIGKLVLWSPKSEYIDSDAVVLGQGDFRYLAIANPKLAPYGKAAQQVLQKKGLWGKLRSRMVRGENIGQTFQFVKSGNAQLGFVAASQLRLPGKKMIGSLWEVPQSLYEPIEQQAVLLKESKIGREFWRFIQSPKSKELIHRFGYGLP